MDIKDREMLRCVARTSLRTKLAEKMADQLTDIITDAVLMIHKEGQPLDLHMVCRAGGIRAHGNEECMNSVA